MSDNKDLSGKRMNHGTPSENRGCIKISAPAPVANLVCGFDILVMALNDPYDIIEMSLVDEPVITIKHADEFNLPHDPSKNVAGAALTALQEAYGRKIGFELVITKSIKPGSGLGSS